MRNKASTNGVAQPNCSLFIYLWNLYSAPSRYSKVLILML